MSKFNPLNYPITLASPARLAPSTWVSHTPFAMFLVDILRPVTIVELGTQYGVSYCAFCQAVQALKLSTRCFAVDTWQGDPQAGIYGNEVIFNLKNYHDPLYGAFSTLIQSTFDDALGKFENKTIDLLHIDGLHTYKAVKNDFTAWLPKMSNRGVILFHDICVREKDFGVWQLWDELKEQYPHFEFQHGYGLGVLAVGKKYPKPLTMLLNNSEEQTIIRDYFTQMGMRAERDNQLGEAAWELQRTLNSKGWRFVRILRRFRLWLLPVNSRREKFIKTLLGRK
jgi:hypothetical protein